MRSKCILMTAGYVKHFALCLMLLLISCSNAEDISNADESYFMPDIDVFVVRASEGGVPGVERFDIPGGYTTHNYIMMLFDGRSSSTVNRYLQSMGVAFNHSRIRIIFIQAPPLTSSDALQKLTSQSSFIITDDTGTLNKGIFYKEDGPLNVYLAGDTTPGASYGGIGWVGAMGCLVLSQGGRSASAMSSIISHELGHNFRLPHPFGAGGNPNPDSCSPGRQGTTNHIMDYTSRPEIFAPCERVLAATFAVDNGFPSMAWIAGDNLENVELYEGTWSGTMTVNSPAAVIPPVSAAIEID